LLDTITTPNELEVILITETWLDDTVSNAILSNNNLYCAERSDRSGRSGGGCAILYKNSPLFKAVSYKRPPQFNDLEVCAIDVLGTVQTRFVCAYLAPDLSNNLPLALRYFDFLHLLSRTDLKLVIVGDFNLPHIDWKALSWRQNPLYDAFFSNFVFPSGLSQLVTDSTYPSSGNVLDLFFTSSPNTVLAINIMQPLDDRLDHNCISFQLDCSVAEKPTRSFPNFKKTHWTLAATYLQTINWDEVLGRSGDPEVLWQNFHGIILQLFWRFVPILKLKRNPFSYPPYIKRLINKKLKAWCPAKVATPAQKEKYSTLVKQCQAAIRKYKIRKEQSVLNSGSLRTFYSYINNKRVSRPTIPPLLNRTGNLCTDDATKCAILNDYFSETFTIDNHDVPDLDGVGNNVTKLENVFFSEQIVYKELLKLKGTSSSGPDNIPSIFYKKFAVFFAYPLSKIFTASFDVGRLPSVWLKSNVVPILKKGSAANPENYRPISLTCIACRIMERTVKWCIMHHLQSNGLLSLNQHGFISKRSVETQLVECTNDWSLALRDGKSVDVNFIDFSKAFDSVVHSKLRVKLAAVGISGKLLNWCMAFLSSRYQRTKIDEYYSQYSEVLSGTGQGTVLGPIFFLIFINDLADKFTANSKTKVKLFADDIKLYSTVDDVSSQRNLQQSLDILVQWAAEWQLTIASKKCWTLRIGKPEEDGFNYVIDGQILDWTSSCRDLGIIVDSKLRFSNHCTAISKKANARCALISNCFTTANMKYQTIAFCSFVRPILEFGSVVWNPHYKSDINLIEATQRRFTKRMFSRCNQPPDLSYEQRLAHLSAQNIILAKLEHRRTIADLKFCYKIQKNMVTIDNSCFTLSTVNPNRLLVPHCLNSIPRKSTFCHRITHLWNHLELEIKRSKSLSIFGKSLARTDVDFLLRRMI